MFVSLIITTFNWKKALSLSIASALSQTRLPDEIIIADDGSSDGTTEMISVIASDAKVKIKHAWQENNGFRAAMIRNKAIAKAAGDYVILLDGDIVVERHFIEDHLSVARPGRFVQGSRVLLNETKTNEALERALFKISIIDYGIENRKNCLRSRFLSSIFSHNSRKITGIKTCNFAFWKQDALQVNGFDEDFTGWGREDSEFASRLMNSGVHRFNFKFMATAYHLYHASRPQDKLPDNDEILHKSLAEKRIRCKNGINKYL